VRFSARLRRAQTLKRMILAVVIGLILPVAALAQWSSDDGPVHWTSNGAPTTTTITGGPWTLEQSGAANGLKSAGYCSNGGEVNNSGTERMEPYYFPVISGFGKRLQGYFDWRPKDIDEGVVAAYSVDAGLSWIFQQKVLELRTDCPTDFLKDADGNKESDPNNADNSNTTGDDGQGHQFVITIGGHTYLYSLVRAAGHIDVDDLSIHEITPQPGAPLEGAPLLNDASTDVTSLPEPPLHTHGLLNPDGILGVVPGSWPLEIIYEQKILNGDNTGSTALPASEQCNTFWANYYATNPFGTAVNDDITYLRLASTTDGINFKDLGPLMGLNDPTTVSFTGTRWLATAGTILRLADGRWGLLFSGGGCVDGDSDAFHYIGYAESLDLIHWTVINGLNNPIISTAPLTLTVNAAGVPATGSGTQSVTIPANPAVVGNTEGFFAGRVYAPSGASFDRFDITVIFAGYHTPKPKNGLGDYRTIGRVSLHASEPVQIGEKNPGDSDDDSDGNH
jgi:hypothetical protein